jgi:hypothetical protein
VRVLTFNSHQPYLHLLAGVLPWKLGVVTPRLPSGRVKHWDERIRPLPGNVHLYDSVAQAVETEAWDWLLAHNVHDLLDGRGLALPKVFLVHGTLSGRILQERAKVDRPRYVQDLRVLLEQARCRVVYISDLKRDDWGIPGHVIRQAIEPAWYGGYRGEVAGVLQVSNYLKERGAILGYSAHRAVCRGLRSLVLGENPDLPESRVSESWEDLRECYRRFRVYLHTAVYPHEDGFNLALLEAMATGMPIAALSHPTSPVVDGVDGVVAADPPALRARVERLLADEEEARRLGGVARERVAQAFPIGEFRRGWEELANEL